MPAATTPQALQFQEPHIVKLTDEERISGHASMEHIAEAIAAMHRDGLVVLENAVDCNHMDKLNKILCEEAEIMAKLPTTHFNDEAGSEPTGNMSQGPPVTPDLMFTDVWANKPASTVISSILGPNPRVNFVNGNTSLPGGYKGRQNVHADLTFNHAMFPFAIVANYYLVDVSPANGSTELWLGSHRDGTFKDHQYSIKLDDPNELSTKAIVTDGKGLKFGISPELLELRREYAPPIQPTVKKGSVVLRDLRLWHGGLPNPGTDPRIMLAFVHTPWWYKCPAKVVLPEAARPLTEGWADRRDSPVVYNTHFVPDGVDHKSIKFTPNFSSDNKGYLNNLPRGVGMGFTFATDTGHEDKEEQ